MKRSKDYTLTTLLIPFLIAVGSCLPGCYNEGKSNNEDEYTKAVAGKAHECKWDKCPYKFVRPEDWHEAITEMTGCYPNEDGYKIDLLHLQNPTYEYDQLDSLLTK